MFETKKEKAKPYLMLLFFGEFKEKQLIKKFFKKLNKLNGG